MRYTLFYHVAFILLCSFTTTSILCPRSHAPTKGQQDSYNPLLRKFADHKTLETLSLNGLRFMPTFLVQKSHFLARNPNKSLYAKNIRRLIKNVMAFYNQLRESLKYDSYTLGNSTAPTVLFEGMGIPETLQFGHAFCVSMLILQVIIYTASADDETKTKMVSIVLKHIQKESMNYDKHNPTRPGFIQSAYTIIENQIFTNEELYDSSTDASSSDDA